MKYKRIAIDTSKSIFTLYGVDADERAILRKDMSRSQFLSFFSSLEPTTVYLEACSTSHHWGRTLQALGHQVLLIPPQYVKPFVKRGKNDHNDAQAINDAASRPDMRFVPIKSAAQQADLLELSCRDLLIRQRTQLVNALRGHAAEFGLIVAKGIQKVDLLLNKIAADPNMPAIAKDVLARIGDQIAHLDAQIAACGERLAAQHKSNEISQRLDRIPGVGPMIALTATLLIDPKQFTSGRHFAAWIGLTPKERSTGGRHTLGGISRAGHEGLRSLLVTGAMAVISHAKQGNKNTPQWLMDLLERRPRKVAAVALANKMARVIWAMMTSGQAYRSPKAA